MRIKFILTTCLGFGLLSGCQQTKQPDDAEVLKNALNNFYDGLKSRDLKKVDEATTGDFILYEDGKVWTNDSLINFLNTFKSFKGDWKFDGMKVYVDDNSGDMSYFNHGDFIVNDTTKYSLDWIESATLRKIDGKWKMNFLHSTVKK